MSEVGAEQVKRSPPGMTPVRASANRPSLSLCADVCWLIVEWLAPLGKDLGALALVNREWSRFVRYSAIYEDWLQQRAPWTYPKLRRAHSERCGDPLDASEDGRLLGDGEIPWRGEVALLRQRGGLLASNAGAAALKPARKGIVSYLSGLFQRKADRRVAVLGLEGSGKSAIRCSLVESEHPYHIPTIGFGSESFEIEGVNYTCMSIGGEKLRPLLRHVVENTSAVIFVVDAADHGRFPDLVHGLEFCNQCLAVAQTGKESSPRSTPLLIFANKQDLPGAKNAEEVAVALRLDPGKGCWAVQDSIATQGKGLNAGLEWIARVLGW
jgi:GTPase SAR1 family protein